MRDNEGMQITSWKFVCDKNVPNSATLEIVADGDVKEVHSEGNGPVDAAFLALGTLLEGEPDLELYQVHAVTKGTDAQAEVTVRLADNGKTVNGHAAHTDTLVASAKAYLNALNKLLVKREKNKPEEMTA
jgi:2-isopropylmalate synthase